MVSIIPEHKQINEYLFVKISLFFKIFFIAELSILPLKIYAISNSIRGRFGLVK